MKMRKMMKRVLPAALVLPLALSVNAYAEEKEKLIMVMYTSTAIQEQVEATLVPFEEANNVDVEVILVALEDYDTKISTMIASGEAPDVIWVAEYQNDEFYSEGMLADLTDLTEDAEWNYEDFAEGQRNHWTYDGKVYGIGFSGAPLVCFYNKTLYEQAGLTTPTELYEKGEWTAEVMIEQAYRLAELGDDIYGIDFSRTGDWANWDVVGTVALRLFGGDAWNDADHSEVLINSEKSVKGLTTLYDMMNSGVHPQAGTTVDFTAGQLGIWPDLFGSIKKLGEVDFEWDMVPMPLNADGGSTAWMGSAAYGVYSGTDQMELAKECVKFMTSEESIAALQFTFVPTRKSVLYSDIYTSGNNGEIARSTNEKAHDWIVDGIDLIRVKQSHEKYTELSQCIVEGLELMYAGAMSPEEAANYMAEEMQAYVK